jgi:hypothetical protein
MIMSRLSTKTDIGVQSSMMIRLMWQRKFIG